MRKVFCIGYPKTGTSSLQSAFGILGFRVTKTWEYFIEWWKVKRNIAPILNDPAFSRILEGHDFFFRLAFFLLYEQLDDRFPGSKFILSTRLNGDEREQSELKHDQRKQESLGPEA